MSKFYTNIDIFGSVSEIPQVIKFHASVVWVFATIICLFVLMYVILIEYRIRLNLGENSEYKLMSFGTAFLICLFGLYIMRIYWTGYIVTHIFDYGIRTIQITMSSKFEIFFYVGVFQTCFIGGFIAFLFSAMDFYINWKQIKE